MTKNEFLNTLEEALTDSVPASVVRENIQYYSSYIDEEEQKGRSEGEVLDELGSPRLIAHTIIDTTPEAASYVGNQSSSSRRGTAYGRDGQYSSGRSSRQGSGSSYHSFHLDMSRWYWKLIVYIVVIAIVMMLITVVSGIMSLLFPVLPIIIVVAMMMLMFGGHGR